MLSLFADMGLITWLVLFVLSIYFISTMWVFIWRSIKLNEISNVELETLELLSSGGVSLRRSFFHYLLDSGFANQNTLNVCRAKSINKITSGLSYLSIVSSTSPFIGLFGTVVEILQAFYQLGGGGGVDFGVIAPIISKALVATAFGIITAIPAYSFFIILKRKAYVISSYLDMQIDIILNNQNNKDSRITLK